MLTLEQSIGKRVVTLRKNLKMNQARLSAESGIDNSTLSRVERGLHNFCIELLKKIIAALEISYNDFFSGLE